jgi:hypothetical protein
VLFQRWRQALRNRHAGGDCKTPIGAADKIRGIERIGKGSLKGYQLCAAKLNESEELMKHR